MHSLSCCVLGVGMATIITVHGTAAAGPEEGQAWWQKGSVFEKHIQELVESEDGALAFEPVSWNGANSETARRATAAKLHKKIKNLEEAKEKYCIVGHSHGGSIAVDALLIAGKNKDRLNYLARWITVGTPFMRSMKVSWLFARAGLFGKSLLVAFALFSISPMSISIYVDIDIYILLPLFALTITPFIGVYVALSLLNYGSFYRYRSNISEFFYRLFVASGLASS